MRTWSFLTNHARVLLFIAGNPDARLRDMAAALQITERSVHGIVTDLVDAAYVVKEKDGRRNRYHVEVDRPFPDTLGRERTIGEVFDLLVDGRRPAKIRATKT